MHYKDMETHKICNRLNHVNSSYYKNTFRGYCWTRSCGSSDDINVNL